jgi:hypothetical protein
MATMEATLEKQWPQREGIMEFPSRGGAGGRREQKKTAWLLRESLMAWRGELARRCVGGEEDGTSVEVEKEREG